MLILKYFNPTGFYSFGKTQTVDLDRQGLVFLNGRNEDQGSNPNGAGKSNFLRTLTRMMTGDDGTKTKVASVVNNTNAWKLGAWGYLQFEKDGEHFRIIEARKWPKRERYPVLPEIMGSSHLEATGNQYTGTGLFFDKWDGEMWRDMRVGKRMEDTRALILDIIGMDFDGFCSTSYLAQRRGLKIIEAKPKERFELISPLADLSLWDKVKTLVNTEFAQINEKAQIAKGRVEEIEHQISSIEMIDDDQIARHQAEADHAQSNIDNTKLQITELEKKLKSIQSSTEEQELIFKLHKAKAELDVIVERALPEVDKLQTKISSVNGGIQQLYRDEQAKITDEASYADISDEDFRRLSSDRDNMIAKASHIRKSLEALTAEEGTCSRCGSAVTADHLEKHRAELEKELKAAETEVDPFRAKAHAAMKELEAAKNERRDSITMDFFKQRSVLQENIEAHQAEIDKLKAAETKRVEADRVIKQAEINKLKADLDEVQMSFHENYDEAATQSTLTELKLSIATFEQQRINSLASIEAAKTHNTTQAKKLSDLMGKFGELQAEMAKYTSDKELHQQLEKEFGRTGIQAFELSTLIDEFNYYVSSYIWTLTDGMLKVELSPYKEKKTAKHAFDHIAEITAVVSDAYKQSTPLELYGGCETQQIVVAMLLAFRHLAMARGAGTNIIALDEIDRAMSPYNTDRLVTLLDHIRKTIPTMFVVSHNERTKNTMPADVVWTAVRRNGISHLEI